MLTFAFKDLSEDEYDFIKDQVGKGNEGLVHDLLIDGTGCYALVQEEKEADFCSFLDRIGVDVK